MWETTTGNAKQVLRGLQGIVRNGMLCLSGELTRQPGPEAACQRAAEVELAYP